MVFYVYVGCRCVGKRRVDGMSTGSPGHAVMGQLTQVAVLAMLLPCTYCVRPSTCCAGHEDDDDGEEV